MQFNKLVRDKIPDIIRGRGGVPHTRVLLPHQRAAALADKLIEEAAEYRQSLEEADAAGKQSQIEELADVLEVLDAIVAHSGLSWEQIHTARAKKREQRGGFDEYIFLERVED